MIDINKVKLGDKVVCIESKGWMLRVGDILELSAGTMSLDRSKINIHAVKKFPKDFEMYIEEEETPIFDMKTQPWKIYVNSEAEYNAANDWLEEKHGSRVPCPYFKRVIGITNRDSHNEVQESLMWLDEFNDKDEKIKRHEIKIQFKTQTTVDSVQYPIIETEKQRKIRELKEGSTTD